MYCTVFAFFRQFGIQQLSLIHIYLLQLLVLFRQLLVVLGQVHDRSVDPHFIAGLAAQQLVDRHTQSLSLIHI